MLKRALGLALGWLALAGMQAPPAPRPELSLWRLDCGEFVIKQYGAF
jgi:N-acyl homoserine lactone hydrolase